MHDDTQKSDQTPQRSDRDDYSFFHPDMEYGIVSSPVTHPTSSNVEAKKAEIIKTFIDKPCPNIKSKI